MSKVRFRSLFRRPLGVFLPVLFVLVAGCTTGQIGGEIENSDRPNDGEASGDSCEEAERTALELSESTSVGMTAQEVIDAVSGTHESSLSWGIDSADVDATLTPAPGESSVTIEVVPRPESAAFVDWELSESEGDGESAAPDEVGQPCADEIQVVADVTMTSANGAFDDTFEVIFHARSASVITGSAAVVPGELEGSFDVSTEGNGEAVQTALSLNFAFGTLSGEIAGVWQEVFGDPGDEQAAVSGGWISYGRFPAEGCEGGALIGEETPLGSAILDAVNSQTEFDLGWQGGETTTLTIEPAVGNLCLAVDEIAGTGTIVGPVNAAITSADGRVDAVWELEVRATLLDGDISSVYLRSLSQSEFGYAAEDFEAATGISGVETEAAELGFDFVYEISPSSETASGTLTILELDIPECARPGYEPEVIETPDGGSGAPGCEGTQFVEIETATFVSTSTPPGE